MAWDPHQDAAVTGYTVHLGINPGSYSQTFDMAGRTNTTFTFSQAVPGTRYYFAVAAYTADGQTSALSGEVSYKINVGPTLNSPGAQTAAVGSSVSLQLSATDDGDPLNYTATGLPTGLTINQSTGRITGSPTTAGSYNVGVTVSDGDLQASTSFAWTVNPRLSVTSLTADLVSPQVANTPIVFTAAATGGVAPYEYKFLQTVNGNTTTYRNWAASNSFSWNPSQPGAYTVTVWVRSAGVTADVAEAQTARSFTITPGPMSVTGLSSSLPSPQGTGTAITLTTAATGGLAPYQYKYLATANGSGVMVTLRDWNTSALYTWTPTQAANWVLTVWVRSAGQTTDAPEASRTLNFVTTAPFVLSGITSNLPSPQLRGTSITFSAVSSGGVGPHQYKWWVSSTGSNWTLLRDWAAGSFTWTPTQPSLYYRILVWARPANVTADISTYTLSVPYVITGPQPLSVTSVTSNLASPQRAGTAITFTANASGGEAPYQYQWYLYNGSTWSVVRTWAAGNTFTWTPAAPGSYQLSVGARNASTTANQPDAASSVNYTVTQSANPLTVTSLGSNVTSPQLTGTPVTFTAATSGGNGPIQYKWWVSNGSSWSVTQNWSGTPAWTWTPSTSGSYQVRVWARNASTTADVADAERSMAFTINPASTPLRVTSLTASLQSPQRAGTTVTFTANATGGTAPYQYQWWLYNGSTWSVAQAWNTASTFTWTPTASGSYQLSVGVRNAGSTSSQPDAALSLNYAISPGQTQPLTVTTLGSSVASPQPAGTPVTFAAATSGGTSPVQYKWFVSSGSGWTVTQNWSSASTWVWTGGTTGSYQVRVWARNATTTADVADAERSTSFTFTSVSTPLRVTSLTSNMPNPQPAGTAITFTANATGGTAPYQYQWWLYNGAVWSVVQAWNAGNTFTWTPTAAGSYQISVGVRNASTTANQPDAAAALNMAITAGQSQQPLALTSLTSSLASPQQAGATVTFAASTSGGTSPVQYKWFITTGSSWTTVQNWSTNPTWTWSGALGGSYQVRVWARNGSTTADAADAERSMSFTFTSSSSPLRVTGLTSSLTSPQRSGTAITFTAAASGGEAPYQYQWWVYNGITWTVARTWNTSPSFTWTPGTGSYQISVGVRGASSTSTQPEAAASTHYVITASNAPHITSLASSVSSPQEAGTSITFIANVSGGTAPFLYQWWIYDGSRWTVVRTWDSSNSFTWTPTAANPNYQVSVGVRDATNPGDNPDAAASLNFAVIPAGRN